jgi:hypothetical protein
VSFQRVLAVVVPIFILAVVGVLVWAIARGVEADPALVGSLVAAGLSVVGGIAVAGYQARLQRKEAAERTHREEITPYYRKLIKVVRGLGKRSSKGRSSDRQDIAFLGDLQDQMLLWSGSKVIRAWVEAMRLAETNPDPADITIAYGQILLAIREELGHEDADLDVRDFLRVFITDIDKHLPPSP